MNKLLFQLRSLSQHKKASNKEKNAIGEGIWVQAQEQLDRVCSPSTGPFSYALLDTLCKTFNYQAIIFSGLLPTPVYVYPLEQEGEPRQDLPCLFFQEVVSLNPESPTTRHLQVILRPELVHKNRHLCQKCFQVISRGIKHRWCRHAKCCLYCFRRRLAPNDHYDCMMERLYCPGAIKGNKAVVTLTNGQCPKCFEKIDSQCCFQRHVKQCQGRTTCSSCHQLIIARQSENLEEKVKLHRCGIRKCLSCYEDIDAAQKQSHCCKLAVRPFLRAYPSLATFDIETWTLPDGQLRDVMLHLAYESRVGGVFNEVTFTHTGLQFPLANMI